jgi:hypothetical protein
MLYGGDPNCGPTSEGIISVYMIKRKLAKHGIIIRSLKWAGGLLAATREQEAPR